ncbi:MAG: hypothetical protein ACLPKI_26055 [Streptosporangiaceae bacterium]
MSQHRPDDEIEAQGFVNQNRHEPVPASRQDERPQAAVQRNEEMRHRTEQQGGGTAPEEDRRPALDRLADEDPAGRPSPAATGAAAQQLMGGPEPQGPVPDAPGVQVAAVRTSEGGADRIRYVSNAVPGQPDGEVDTRR